MMNKNKRPACRRTPAQIRAWIIAFTRHRHIADKDAPSRSACGVLYDHDGESALRSHCMWSAAPLRPIRVLPFFRLDNRSTPGLSYQVAEILPCLRAQNSREPKPPNPITPEYVLCTRRAFSEARSGHEQRAALWGLAQPAQEERPSLGAHICIQCRPSWKHVLRRRVRLATAANTQDAIPSQASVPWHDCACPPRDVCAARD